MEMKQDPFIFSDQVQQGARSGHTNRKQQIVGRGTRVTQTFHSTLKSTGLQSQLWKLAASSFVAQPARRWSEGFTKIDKGILVPPRATRCLQVFFRPRSE